MSRRYSLKFDREDVALTLGKEYRVCVYDGDVKCVTMLKYIRQHTHEMVAEKDILDIDKTWVFELISGDPGSGRVAVNEGVMLDDNCSAVTIVEAKMFMVVQVGGVSTVEAALRMQEFMQRMSQPVQFQKIEMPKHEVADRPRTRNWHIIGRNKNRK